MSGPWYRAIPTPGTTRIVNNVTEFNSAYTASAAGDRIQLNAGTYDFGTTILDIAKNNLQLKGNGHATIDGKTKVSAIGCWFIDLEFTDPTDNGGVQEGILIQNDNISFINCWSHHFADGRNCLLNPAGNSGTLLYGSVFHDSRHVCYLQNLITEAKCWMAHCYVGDVLTPLGSNSYNIHEWSTGSPENARNWSYHENIISKGLNVVGGQTVSQIAHTNEFKNCIFYRAGLRQLNRPNELIFEDCRSYETLFELGASSGYNLAIEAWHGAGETQFGYAHPGSIQRCLFYKPNDLATHNMLIQTRRYVAGGREDGIPPLRDALTGELIDTNSYYGFNRWNLHANNVITNNITTLAAFRAATLSAGNQWDTSSTLTAGVPPNYYVIWQNDYNPDRAMIAVLRYTGSSVAVTLPRVGDIYEIHDQWGVPSYTGSASYNITQQPFFGIIKYTGGAMPQFARPSADTNNPGSWTDQAGGSTTIYTTIDETTPNDADYVRSPSAPSSSVYVTKLSNVSDPASSTGHVLRTRYNKDAAGGAQINLTVELRQGYVSEASLGTLIATRTFTNISDVFVTDAYTLTGSEADAITDYTSLYVRFLATQV